MQIRVLPRAERDADEIYVYLAKRTRDGAAAWWKAFLIAIGELELTWRQCAQAPESARIDRDLRHFLFKTRRGRNYRGVFIVVGEEIRILRVRGPGQPPLTRRALQAE